MAVLDQVAPPRTLRLSPRDNIAVALDSLPEGTQAAGCDRGGPRARAATSSRWWRSPMGRPSSSSGDHRFRVRGHSGRRPCARAQCGAARFRPRLCICCGCAGRCAVAAGGARPFHGFFRRSNGRTGTRNYIGILTSVNCSASVARFAAQELERSGLLEAFPGVDGIVPIVHGTGCGMASKGEGFDVLSRTLWGYATHPNFAAVVMVGLGCEIFQIARFKSEYGVNETDSFRTLTIQDEGGTRQTVSHIVGALKEMLPGAAACRREARPLSELVLALQCGGSDGLFRPYRQPRAGCRLRPSGAPWGHVHSLGDTGNLRGRASAHAARRQPRSG